MTGLSRWPSDTLAAPPFFVVWRRRLTPGALPGRALKIRRILLPRSYVVTHSKDMSRRLADARLTDDLRDETRTAWQRYLDLLTPFRPELHRYCRRLTGNVWDAEDLVQDT